MASISKASEPEVASDKQARRERATAILKAIEARDDIRFAVGSSEAGFSHTWIVRAHRGSYYVGVKGLAGYLKISVHPPKDSWSRYVGRLALTTEFINSRLDLGMSPSSRVFTKWDIPVPPAKGAHAPLAVIFPTDHLYQNKPNGKRNKPLLLFSPAPKGHAVEVWFFHSVESIASLEPKLAKFGLPVLRNDLADGASVSVVVRQHRFDPQLLPTEEAVTRGRMQWLESEPRPPVGTRWEQLSGLFWNKPKNGETLWMVDVGGITMNVGA